MLIRDVSFVVTDTETTGTFPDRDRLIEIGAVKVRNGQIVDTFSQLINPGRSIPYFISRLTGISTAMVYDQPSAEQVLPRFMEFLGDGVLVAHNLNFDERFINAELVRVGEQEFNGDAICTLKLARRLLAGLRSKGLAGLAEFYKIKNKARHRALGDAEVTAEVLLRFLPRLETEYSLETIEQLVAFQNSRYAQPGTTSKHVLKIRNEVLPLLPDRPGVYFMKDGRGRLIYVGKAKSLANRVRSYFTGIEGHQEHIRKMVSKVRHIEWTETGSELAALLLESRLIKEKQPDYNRASLRYRNRPFIRLDVTERYPRVSLSNLLTNDGAEYFGPLPSRTQADFVMDVVSRYYKLRECTDDVFARPAQCVYFAMNRCEEPCRSADASDGYAQQVERVRSFLAGKDRSVLEILTAEMKAAAAKLEFEQAADRRNLLQTLETLLNRQRCIASPVLEHDAVLVLPSLARHAAQVYFVRFGRNVDTLTVSSPPTESDLKLLDALCRKHFDPELPTPDRYMKQEVDEVRLLAHYMYVYRETSSHIAWHRGMDMETFQARIVATLATAPVVEADVAIEEDVAVGEEV